MCWVNHHYRAGLGVVVGVWSTRPWCLLELNISKLAFALRVDCFIVFVLCLKGVNFELVLCCRGQVRLVHGSGATGLQLVQSYSDSDEDSDGAWEGRLGDRYNPPGKPSCYFICAQINIHDIHSWASDEYRPIYCTVITTS